MLLQSYSLYHHLSPMATTTPSFKTSGKALKARRACWVVWGKMRVISIAETSETSFFTSTIRMMRYLNLAERSTVRSMPGSTRKSSCAKSGIRVERLYVLPGGAVYDSGLGAKRSAAGDWRKDSGLGALSRF